jgi:hypothetical protein
VDALDPNENPEGYILHLEDLLRDRQRTIKDLEWKLKEVGRCATIQEECALTFQALAESMKVQRDDLLAALKALTMTVSKVRMAEFKDTPSGGMEVMQNGVWTTVPFEAAAEIRRLRYMIADWTFAPNGRSFAALENEATAILNAGGYDGIKRPV